MIAFDQVWQRIETHSGERFEQIRGGEFFYKVESGHVIPDRTNQQIPKSNFEKAFSMVPLPDTTMIQNLRGPFYIYAILMDKRIRLGDW